jgi:hypothetical protein
LDAWILKRARRTLPRLLKKAGLDLSGMNVYTEAATESYACGAAIALLAGAQSVHCMARDSRFGPARDAIRQTRAAAAGLGADVARLTFSEGHDARALELADLVTNMGMLRPLNAELIQRLRPGTVISLMYEAWELRSGDIDFTAAKQRGVVVVGVRENHRAVECHHSAAVLLLRGLLEAGLAVFCDELLLVCANPFALYAVPGLAAQCDRLYLLDRGYGGPNLPRNVQRVFVEDPVSRAYDALLLLDVPQEGRWTVAADKEAVWPLPCLGTWDVCVQAMGDVRREDFPGVKFVPDAAPARGYMGLNPAALGIDLVARTVVAGLSAAAEARTALAACREPPGGASPRMQWAVLMNGEAGQ